MRNPGGFTFSTDINGAMTEGETFTCKHCGTVKIVKPRERPEDLGGLCKVCMGLICDRCASTMRCDPLEEKLLRMEASYEARRSYGI